MIAVFAQPKATATANISAQIIRPIEISKTADMNFGNIISSTEEGTVVLSTDNSTTVTGGAFRPNATLGTITSAVFETTGFANAVYAITLPSGNSVKISNGGTGSANEMFVNTFLSSPSENGILGTDGKQSFNVGATLIVKADQATGVYTGTFDAKVNYN